MLAVKGKCTLCKKFLSILEPGIVCFQCEKYHHGSCLTPPHDMKMITKCVLSKTGWLCPRCSGNVVAKISWKTRTDEDVVQVKEKIDIIVEVKEILALIEAALKSMSAKCKELNDEAISYSDQNKIMKEKIKLHEKYKNPKNFQEWQRGRKKLGVGQEIRRKPVRKTKNAEEAAQRRKELEKHLKKEHLIKPSKKEKTKISETKTTKKGGKLVYYTDKILSKGWLVQILLFLTMIAYTFIGALIFMVIEGRYEEELVNEILTERQRVLNNFSNQSLSEYYDFLAEKYGSNSKLLARGEEELNWSFVGSLFFCGTTYTTIGYGDITPVTNAGKIFTIIYAMIGIPLFLILLASLGKTILKLLDCNILKSCKKTETEEEYFEMDKTDNDKPSNVPLWHMMMYVLILILIGIIVFYVGEGWHIEDSIYFIFITLYTIGFGDIYPTNRSYMLICVLYIVIGLVFASMTISLVAETLKAKVSLASNKLSKKIVQYADEKR